MPDMASTVNLGRDQITARKPNIWGLTRVVFRLFDVLRGPSIFELFWHICVATDRLDERETEALHLVFGPTAKFDKVNIAQGRLLNFIFKVNKGRSFVTFHTINYYGPMDGSARHMAGIVHEMVHVYQFETVGSVYLWEALRAQWAWKSDAYSFGSWQSLSASHEKGVGLQDYGREQQAAIAEYYCRDILSAGTTISDEEKAAYEPFILELRNRQV